MPPMKEPVCLQLVDSGDLKSYGSEQEIEGSNPSTGTNDFGCFQERSADAYLCLTEHLLLRLITVLKSPEVQWEWDEPQKRVEKPTIGDTVLAVRQGR